MTRLWTVVGSLSLAIMLSACGEPRGSIETIEPLPRSVLAQWVGKHLLEQHRHQFETDEAE